MGDATVRTVTAAAVPALLDDGTLDLALIARWPGSVEHALAGLESLSVAGENLVAVGGTPREAGESVSLDELAHGLLIAGPHPESLLAVTQLFAGLTRFQVLVHSVPDLAIGGRLASITGGGMALPESMVGVGPLPIRPFDPPLTVETVLVATTSRARDPEVIELADHLRATPQRVATPS